MYCREMLSTAELVPVVTHQGYFKIGDFKAKREALPRGGFEPSTLPPGSQSTVDWTVMEAVLMTIYSAGCIVTGEPPQLLVTHLGHEVTGRTTCLAVTPWVKPYACQAAWAAATLGHHAIGSKIFDELTETLRTSNT